MAPQTTAPRPASAPAEATLTVEQLAFETGMSVRNIRSHQARGLLAPPAVRMRVGYYGPKHVAQLRLIRELQDEGFNLGGIKRLLDDSQGTAERLLRLRRTITAPPGGEPPHVVTLAELAERFRLDRATAQDVLARADALGLLVPIGDNRYEVPAPGLLAAAEEAVRRGIPLQAAIAVIEELDRHSDEVARGFVQLFLQEVWTPFQQTDMPPERWAELEEAIARLRPLASEAVLAIFQRRLTAQIDAAFGEITDALAQARR
ncbi:MAG TPA: MerR family transcriptional regulator [Solirubrobacteraceae bacterium]|nr:MerR family transcriptional regulator [Solirubrobacteraceae bacterium]